MLDDDAYHDVKYLTLCKARQKVTFQWRKQKDEGGGMSNEFIMAFLIDRFEIRVVMNLFFKLWLKLRKNKFLGNQIRKEGLLKKLSKSL